MVETTKRSFVERLRDRLAARKAEDEQGSLLLDVLIGMAIFALIALIAVSAINGYRQRAYLTGANNDAKALGLELVANYTDTQSYPAAQAAGAGWTVAASTATPNPNGYVYTPLSGSAIAYDTKATKNDTVAAYALSTDGQDFCITVAHHQGNPTGAVDAWATYTSKSGAIDNSQSGRVSAGQTAPTSCTV